jgi:hypothetical protein
VELERWAGLQQFIGAGRVSQGLRDIGRRHRSHCRLTHQVMLGVVLARGVLTDRPLREVFRCATRRQPGQKPPGRAGLCRARPRLGVAPVRRLFHQVVRPLARPGRPGGSYAGLRLVGIDGTVLDGPDSPANARAFGRPHGGRGDGAFPQVRTLSLVELGTHAELALVLKPCATSEQALFGGLVRQLRPGMLLLCDQDFFSFGRWQQLSGRGVELLWRVQSPMTLVPEPVLADGSYLARVYPSPQHRLRGQGGRLVRLIRYTRGGPQRPGHGQVHTLLTALLDPLAHPATALILLYHERWEQELTYDEQKTHPAPRPPGQEAQVRSATPAGVVQEVYALALGHYVTRALMAEATAAARLDPGRRSFIGCLRILRLRLPECARRRRAEFRRWSQELLAAMAAERLPPRRNRINPRVVKRKLSQFPTKRAYHRPVPPLNKKFAEAIVIQT